MKIKFAFILLIISPLLAHSQQLDGYDGVSKLQQQVWMDKKLESAIQDIQMLKEPPVFLKSFIPEIFILAIKHVYSG